MDFGSFVSGLLTGLREGVEAALIVAIVLAYLHRTGNGGQSGKVWIGASVAVVLSAILGIAIYSTVGAFKEPYEQIFEATTMLLAAAVVTWMLFWMRRQAAGIKGELQSSVDKALDRRRRVGPRAARVHRGHSRGRRDLAVPRRPGHLGRARARPRSWPARSSGC